MKPRLKDITDVRQAVAALRQERVAVRALMTALGACLSALELALQPGMLKQGGSYPVLTDLKWTAARARRLLDELEGPKYPGRRDVMAKTAKDGVPQ